METLEIMWDKKKNNWIKHTKFIIKISLISNCDDSEAQQRSSNLRSEGILKSDILKSAVMSRLIRLLSQGKEMAYFQYKCGHI